MFALPAPAVIETRCRSFPLPSRGSRGVVGGMKRVVYDFIEMPLGAVERGPHATVRERRAERMTSAELQRPFARRADHITRCWKWFTATHPGGDTKLDVRLAIDAFGATDGIAIMNAPEDADLAACVRDAFAAPLYVYGSRQRDQQTHVTVHFRREDQPAWTKVPARPAPVANEPVPQRGTTCVRIGGPPIASRLHPLRVTDFDPSRIPKPQPGIRTRAPAVPMVRIGCVSMSSLPKKKNLRGALQSNWGAYEACHAEARTRMPELAGTVHAKLLFDAYGGEPTLASVYGAGDTDLHACLDRALEQIWLDPPTEGTLIEANFTFVLSTEKPLPVRDLAWWRAHLENARSPIDGCRARHELAVDRLAAAPWIDDARVRAAFAELARYIASLDRETAATCLAEADDTLRDYTDVGEQTLASETASIESHVDRLEAVRTLARIAPWGPNLVLALAHSYRKDPARFAEGTALLEELQLDARLGDRVRVDDEPRPIQNSCAL
jgi:hypothetical protein